MLPVREPAAFLAWLEARRKTFYPEIERTVRTILDDVRARGDDALYELTQRLDGVDLRPLGLEVGQEERRSGARAVPDDLRAALEQAAANIRAFHEPQRPRSWWQLQPDGSVLGQQVSTPDRVGIYVPGGQAPLYSCLLMTAIPARVAGVPELVLCTPPAKDGSLHPAMLAAAEIAGVDRIFRVGGAQAVAALAYGTATVPRVDLIVGPGNLYVTMAKRLVFGPVGIDMLAGPTELACVDDGSVPAEWVAADLLSQAEHPQGMVVLITCSEERAQAVAAAAAAQSARQRYGEQMRANLRELGAALVVPSLDEAAQLVNAIAPEHLELLVRDPWPWLGRIRHAGSIFVGPWTPESIGDYIAGPSNVIPTEGVARYASPVNVETFVKRSAVVLYSAEAFRRLGPAAARLAHGEGLPGHAAALEVRLAQSGPEGQDGPRGLA